MEWVNRVKAFYWNTKYFHWPVYSQAELGQKIYETESRMMDCTREDYQRMREKLLEQENLIDELKARNRRQGVSAVQRGAKSKGVRATKPRASRSQKGTSPSV
jgi:hypothetical protein